MKNLECEVLIMSDKNKKQEPELVEAEQVTDAVEKRKLEIYFSDIGDSNNLEFPDDLFGF